MGRKHAKIVSRDAFMKSFVEAEYIMRKNLARQVEEAIKTETNPATIVGMKKSIEIIFGKVKANDVG